MTSLLLPGADVDSIPAVRADVPSKVPLTRDNGTCDMMTDRFRYQPGFMAHLWHIRRYPEASSEIQKVLLTCRNTTAVVCRNRVREFSQAENAGSIPVARSLRKCWSRPTRRPPPGALFLCRGACVRDLCAMCHARCVEVDDGCGRFSALLLGRVEDGVDAGGDLAVPLLRRVLVDEAGPGRRVAEAAGVRRGCQ
jgi:hypothetical protein